MTRARKHLTLLFATTRFKYGSVDFCTPSRFLKDIDSRYLSVAGGQSLGTVPFGSGENFRFSNPKLEPNGTVPGSRFEPKRGFGGRDAGARFEPKAGFERKLEKKPWEQGKFQVVTEDMLKNSAPSSDSVLHEGNAYDRACRQRP